VKLEALSLTAINSTHRVRRGNKMHARKKGPELGSVYTQNEAMKDVLARCHKKTDVQVCTLTIMHCCPVTKGGHPLFFSLVRFRWSAN
jgi:hypothetical protein